MRRFAGSGVMSFTLVPALAGDVAVVVTCNPSPNLYSGITHGGGSRRSHVGFGHDAREHSFDHNKTLSSLTYTVQKGRGFSRPFQKGVSSRFTANGASACTALIPKHIFVNFRFRFLLYLYPWEKIEYSRFSLPLANCPAIYSGRRISLRPILLCSKYTSGVWGQRPQF